MTVPHEFLTLEGLGHCTSAAVGILAVSFTFHHIFGADAQITAIIASNLVTYGDAGASGTLQRIEWKTFPTPSFFRTTYGWLLPLIDACILFTVVVGASNLVPAFHVTGSVASKYQLQ